MALKNVLSICSSFVILRLVVKPLCQRRPRMAPQLLCFGDSFVGTFKLISRASPSLVRTHVFGGATARGLSNPESTLGTSEALITKMPKSLQRHTTAVLVFGNVDLQMSYIFRLLQYPWLYDGEEYHHAFIEEVVTCYTEWLRSIFVPECERRGGIKDVCISTALLPVVGDDALATFADKYVNQPQTSHRGDRAVQEADWSFLGTPSAVPQTCLEAVNLLVQRTRSRLLLQRRQSATKVYNDLLASSISNLAASCALPIHLIDINPFLTSPSRALAVKSEYISSDPTNVHILWEETPPFWITSLESLAVLPVDENGSSDLQKAMDGLDLKTSASEYSAWKGDKQGRPREADLWRERVAKGKVSLWQRTASFPWDVDPIL